MHLPLHWELHILIGGGYVLQLCGWYEVNEKNV